MIKIKKRDGDDERRILTGMIVSCEVVETIREFWKPDLFRSRHANLIAEWCVKHFDKHGDAPGEHIEQKFQEWSSKRSDESTVEMMERFLSSLSGEFDRKRESIKPQHTIEIADRYFRTVQVERLKEDLELDIDAGNLDKAVSKIEGFAPFTLNGESDVERASESESRRVKWMWRGWMAYGHLAIIDGDPTVGKSTILCDIASRVSRGWEMPPKPRKKRRNSSPKNVLYITREDSWHDTSRPRLEAAGGNMKRIFRWTGPPISFPNGIRRLERLVKRHKIKLVIFDPIVSFMDPKLNTNDANDVRSVTDPLKELAEKHHFAVLMIRHFTKAHGAPAIHRGTGSGAWTQAVRFQHIAVKTPERDFVLSPGKSSLVKDEDKKSLRYEFASKNLVVEGFTENYGIVEWSDCDDDLTADDHLARTRMKGRPGKTQKPAELIVELLKQRGGSMPSRELKAIVCKAAEISSATYEKAKHLSGAMRGGKIDGAWHTILPE